MSSEQQRNNQAYQQNSDRHINHMRVQVGKQKAPERKLVNRKRNHPAGAPVVKGGYWHACQKGSKLLFQLNQPIEIPYDSREIASQKGSRKTPRQAINERKHTTES